MRQREGEPVRIGLRREPHAHNLRTPNDDPFVERPEHRSLPVITDLDKPRAQLALQDRGRQGCADDFPYDLRDPGPSGPAPDACRPTHST
jgi:hypothetical protein